MNPQFQISTQYNQYLQRVGLDENRMSIMQHVETKRAFFAAFGQALLLLRDDVGALPENEGVVIMEDLLNQVTDFWTAQLETSEKTDKKITDLANLSLTDLQTIKDHSAMVAGNCSAWLKHVTATDLTVPQVLPSQKELDDTKAALAEAESIYKQAATEFNLRIRTLFK